MDSLGEPQKNYSLNNILVYKIKIKFAFSVSLDRDSNIFLPFPITHTLILCLNTCHYNPLYLIPVPNEYLPTRSITSSQFPCSLVHWNSVMFSTWRVMHYINSPDKPTYLLHSLTNALLCHSPNIHLIWSTIRECGHWILKLIFQSPNYAFS